MGYYEDGPDLVTMAMNGWGPAEPAWWLNLQAHPDAVVDLAGGIRREVTGRAATGSERERLWQRWRESKRGRRGSQAWLRTHRHHSQAPSAERCLVMSSVVQACPRFPALARSISARPKRRASAGRTSASSAEACLP